MHPRYNSPVPLSLQARLPRVTEDLLRALNEPGEALAPVALAIAGVEYPALDAAPYLQRLERMGEAAAGRLQRHLDAPASVLIATLNAYLYEELGFSGNRDHYDDPRNSFLNEVLDRRLGIPISLAVVYLEIGRRAGLRLEGVNFPGHFLVRAPAVPGELEDSIVDPFHAGALLSEVDCRHLLRQHLGEEAAFDHGLLATATRQHIVVRMLVNLKRLYVRMRSFPQARAISDLLLAVDPSALAELRDRGLLAYHMEDFAAALKDLEAYLRLMPRGDANDPEQDIETAADGEDGDEQPASESAQIWEHVKTLRRRVAGFN
jgi:regulator of sirC expression with transglutaminase-like and TPR domain